MSHFLKAVGALALTTAAAHAGGIDRSGQGLGSLFEQGSYVELSFGRVTPNVSGNDVAMFGGGPSGDVGNNYNQIALSYKTDINDKVSMALVLDQPFGADVLYASTSVALGGTSAQASSTALTGLVRYKINDAFSVIGGLRAQQAEAAITLRGAAYGGLNGYSVELDRNLAAGYVVGVAFEKPEIALRVALTYNSAITHTMDTVERLGAAVIGVSPTEVKTPQTINLDFQSGVAKNTLVYGQIRWSDWSEFKVDPQTFTGLAGGGLIDLEDTLTYTLGVGRKINDNWAGSFSVSYEDDGDPLVSPLAPGNGKLGMTLAAVYTRDNMKISAGINYTRIGNAMPETGTPDTARANFTGNKAVGIGIKIGYSF